MSKKWLIALAASLVITATAEARSTVNKSIKIGAGEKDARRTLGPQAA